MTVEVHIARPVLATVVGRAAQQQLRVACFPALGPIRVDHVNAVPDAAEFTAVDGGVRAKVPVDIVIVSEDSLLAAPNAEPVTTGIHGFLMLSVVTEGAKATLRVVDADLDPSPMVGLDEVKKAIIASVSKPITFDLTTALASIGAPAVVSATVELTAETVVVRFDPTDPVLSRLHPGQQWGVHLDESALKEFAHRQVPNLPEVEPRIISFDPTEHWRPEGDRPRIDVEFRGMADVPDPLSGDFDGVFRLRPGLGPTVQSQLRVDVEWEFHVDLGPLVPGFLDNIAEAFAKAMIDPTKFQAVRTGLMTFQRDLPLPLLEYGPQVAGIATRFQWQSVLADAHGMTIGGPVRPLSDPGVATLQLAVTPFGRPRGTVYASQHGCIAGWDGATPDDLAVVGRAELDNCGRVCGFQVLEPHPDLEQYVEVEETSPEFQTLRMRLPLAVAKEVVAPVQVIISTGRGVRLVDLGMPLANEEAEIGYVDDCLYADAATTAQMAYDEWMALYGDLAGRFPVLGAPPHVPNQPNPLDDPDYLAEVSGVYTKVINVEGWEPGELVQVRTLAGTVNVTTDQQGRAAIPVILAGADRAQPIALTRVNRGSVSSARAQTAIFVRYAALPRGALGNTLTTDATGNTLVSADFEDGSDLYELVQNTGPRRLGSRSTKPISAVKAPPALEIELPGLAEIVPVPGFDDAPVAIAVMDDGAQLVLNRSADGTTRVAGTFNGYLPRLDVAGEWALGSASRRLTVFRRSRA